VRRISTVRRKILDLGAVCVFSELQFDAGLVRVIAEGTPARTAALDPLGVDAPDGADGYFHVMRRLARTIVDCLAGSR
jgi:zinc transport system substrate-binding protein